MILVKPFLNLVHQLFVVISQMNDSNSGYPDYFLSAVYAYGLLAFSYFAPRQCRREGIHQKWSDWYSYPPRARCVKLASGAFCSHGHSLSLVHCSKPSILLLGDPFYE